MCPYAAITYNPWQDNVAVQQGLYANDGIQSVNLITPMRLVVQSSMYRGPRGLNPASLVLKLI